LCLRTTVDVSSHLHARDLLDGLDQLGPVDREAYLAKRATDVEELKDLRRALQWPVEDNANTYQTPSGALQRPSETVGSWVERLARLCMSREAFDLYVGPAIADIQHEYLTAVRDRRKWLARWYVIRGVFWLVRPWTWAAVFAKAVAWWGRIS
jgi:hypothetical protein